MKQKLTIFLLVLFLIFPLMGCMEWIKFDLSRLAFGFILTLVIGVIGLIVMALRGGNKD
ncbi:MAG: hypothetical protein U9N53_03025 [Bacteroidota bacterium]|nr:hypothetical protein [Bacteroidota bacterium]